MPKQTANPNDNDFTARTYPDLPYYGDPAENRAKKRAAKEQTSQQQSDADLRALIERQANQLKQQERTMAALMAQPARTRQRPQMPEIDPKKLPDPMNDPQGYFNAVREAVSRQTRAQQEASDFDRQEQEEQQRRLNSLWSDFSEQHKEYASDQDKVRIAAERVIAKQRDRGLDVQKYMFGATPLFMEDVVDEYNRFFGKPKSEQEGKGDTPKPAAQAGNDEDEDHRTMGMFGGQEGGGRVTSEDDDETGGDIADWLREFQTKTGFHR